MGSGSFVDVIKLEQKLGESQNDSKATWKILNESINRNPFKSSEIYEVKVHSSSITKAS